MHDPPAEVPGGPDEQVEASEEAETRFLEGLIARGEAAEADADGNLPDGATHELVTDEEGCRRAVRRRFFGLGDV